MIYLGAYLQGAEARANNAIHFAASDPQAAAIEIYQAVRDITSALRAIEQELASVERMAKK